VIRISGVNLHSLFFLFSSKADMRPDFISFVFLSSLASAACFAAQAETPCNWMDQDALAALHLVESTTKVEHKKTSATASAPAYSTDVCTISPQTSRLPILTIITTALPKGAGPGKPTCSEQPVGKSVLTMCSTAAKGSLVTFMLMSSASADGSLKKTFRSQVERLTK
jgi:hypothetical protein